MVVTLSGMVMLVKLLQLLKADEPIVVTLSVFYLARVLLLEEIFMLRMLTTL